MTGAFLHPSGTSLMAADPFTGPRHGAAAVRVAAFQDSVADGADEAVVPLTREQAEMLRAKHPSVSPWRVVAIQAMAGLLVAAVWWLASARVSAVLSALYGAMVVVAPQALLAYGLDRLKRAHPGVVVAGFMFWEFVKIGLAVALLVGAAVALRWLEWPAVLVAMVVCMKTVWLALLWQSRRGAKGKTKVTTTVGTGL